MKVIATENMNSVEAKDSEANNPEDFDVVHLPLLTGPQRTERLEFAQRLSGWPEDMWMRVIWAEESWVVWGEDGLPRWVFKGEDLRALVGPSEEEPEIYTVWACASGGGLGYMEVWHSASVPPKVRECLMVEHAELFAYEVQCDMGRKPRSPHDEREWVCMTDGLTVPTTDLTGFENGWGHDEMISEVEHWQYPVGSLDLNPVRHLWGLIRDHINSVERREVEQYGERKKFSTDVMWWYINHAVHEWKLGMGDWHEFLAKQMPKRLEAICAAKGGHTEYSSLYGCGPVCRSDRQ
jgi:hypothetical protein